MTEQEVAYAELERALAAPRFARLYQDVRARFQAARSLGHDWEHVRRVVVHAALFCRQEGADPDVVLPGAVLHDLGYVMVPGDPRRHHVHGAEGCHALLGDWGPAQREAIARCVLKHKGRFPGFEAGEPETLEERVVCDADQVDKFGWVGVLQVVRVFTEYGLQGAERFRTLEGLADGLSMVGAIHLYTGSAREFVRRRAGPDLAGAAARLREELALYQGREG